MWNRTRKSRAIPIKTKHNMQLPRYTIICATASLSLFSCKENSPAEWVQHPNVPENTGKKDPTPGNNENTQSGYNEQYRPQFHYTPAKNWINDPNGLVYLDGTWHMFYQYNPYSADWGNMSWGHATSTDLMHWTEQPVAISKCAQGDIFSGSCVIDKDNTAGFGKNAMVAIYTANGTRQQQNIAYSLDGGKTFEQFSGNPVIANTSREHFRGPKVF